VNKSSRFDESRLIGVSFENVWLMLDSLDLDEYAKIVDALRKVHSFSNTRKFWRSARCNEYLKLESLALLSDRNFSSMHVLGSTLRHRLPLSDAVVLLPASAEDADVLTSRPGNPLEQSLIQAKYNVFRREERSRISGPAVPQANDSRTDAELLLDAADGFSNLMSTVESLEDEDEQYDCLAELLPPFLLNNPKDGLVEVQRAVLDPTRDARVRALILAAVSHVQFPNNERIRAHLDFIVSRALRSDSHFVRSAAVTAALALGSSVDELRIAIANEKIVPLRKRMQNVAGKLESRRFGTAAALRKE
jgi:hypothetical protein